MTPLPPPILVGEGVGVSVGAGVSVGICVGVCVDVSVGGATAMIVAGGTSVGAGVEVEAVQEAKNIPSVSSKILTDRRMSVTPSEPGN